MMFFDDFKNHFLINLWSLLLKTVKKVLRRMRKTPFKLIIFWIDTQKGQKMMFLKGQKITFFDRFWSTYDHFFSKPWKNWFWSSLVFSYKLLIFMNNPSKDEKMVDFWSKNDRFLIKKMINFDQKMIVFVNINDHLLSKHEKNWFWNSLYFLYKLVIFWIDTDKVEKRVFFWWKKGHFFWLKNDDFFMIFWCFF